MLTALLALVAALVGLLGWNVWERNKRQGAEALNENIEEKRRLLELEQKKIQDLAEEAERTFIRESTEAKKMEKVTDEELEKFFKDFLNRKPDDTSNGNSGNPT